MGQCVMSNFENSWKERWLPSRPASVAVTVVWPNQYSETSICPGLLLLYLCPHGLLRLFWRQPCGVGRAYHWTTQEMWCYVGQPLTLSFVTGDSFCLTIPGVHQPPGFTRSLWRGLPPALLRNSPPHWPSCLIAAHFFIMRETLWSGFSVVVQFNVLCTDEPLWEL